MHVMYCVHSEHVGVCFLLQCVDILRHSVFGMCSVDNYKTRRNKFYIETDVRQKTAIDSQKKTTASG